jgi:hypothetical protein
MATGEVGRGFSAELNRLANGGTYPVPTAFKGDLAAANTWAGSTARDLIGALNYKASSSRQPSAYKDLNGICNELAGTTDKEATEALRSLAL